MKLQEYRGKIDEIDKEIIALFQNRMALSQKIAAYKREHHLPIYVPEREAEKLESMRQQAPELAAYVEELYQTIFRISRAYQEEYS